MESKVVLSVIVAAAMVVSPAFAAKTKDTYELKGALSAYTAAAGSTPGSLMIQVTNASPGLDATGLQALTPKQVVEKTGS